MKVSEWKKSDEILEFRRAWLASVNVETDADGRPHTCIMAIARFDNGGNVVTKIIELNAAEMLNMIAGEWQHAQHEYTNKVMLENRKSLGLEESD